MAVLRVATRVLTRDFERIREHLHAHQAERIEERLESIFEALSILRNHPSIGRLAADGCRELVIGEGAHGYVARYRHDRVEDAVEVLAVRAQRERGFRAD
jgi:plasmid stabilization system protein ParE